MNFALILTGAILVMGILFLTGKDISQLNFGTSLASLTVVIVGSMMVIAGLIWTFRLNKQASGKWHRGYPEK